MGRLAVAVGFPPHPPIKSQVVDFSYAPHLNRRFAVTSLFVLLFIPGDRQ